MCFRDRHSHKQNLSGVVAISASEQTLQEIRTEECHQQYYKYSFFFLSQEQDDLAVTKPEFKPEFSIYPTPSLQNTKVDK